jgi:pyrimidine deaminase RibD-like protein
MILIASNSTGISKRDVALLNRARNIAFASTERHKHGALVYHGGRVLGVGINAMRNQHPTMEIDFSAYTTHAEIAAMRSTAWRRELTGATIYVARVNVRTCNQMNSKPCRDCVQAMEANGIKRVVYSV